MLDELTLAKVVLATAGSWFDDQGSWIKLYSTVARVPSANGLQAVEVATAGWWEVDLEQLSFGCLFLHRFPLYSRVYLHWLVAGYQVQPTSEALHEKPSLQVEQEVA